MPHPIPIEAIPARGGQRFQFHGRAEIRNVSEAAGTEETKVRHVAFEAGARSRPHAHPFDQLLYFLQPGIVAVDGGDDVLIEAGEVVVLPANVPHMHGACEGAPSAHLSIMREIGSTEYDVPMPAGWERYRAGP